jgi:hypothetical protein
MNTMQKSMMAAVRKRARWLATTVIIRAIGSSFGAEETLVVPLRAPVASSLLQPKPI